MKTTAIMGLLCRVAAGILLTVAGPFSVSRCKAWECDLVIQGGDPAPSEVCQIAFDMPTNGNVAELVASGAIVQASCLMRRDAPDGAVVERITVGPEAFSFDPLACVLSLDLGVGAGGPGELLPGFYRIRLCGDFLLMGMPKFSAETLVQQGDGPIQVGAYSVPSMADWNGDGIADLIVGEKVGTDSARVRIWINEGTAENPSFADLPLSAATASGEIAIPASGCLGVFPRLVDWDRDGREDLLTGIADGRILFWRNAPESTPENPIFEEGVELCVGDTTIDVGARATFDIGDWNGDGVPDLITGALDGKIRVYLNLTADGLPDLTDPILLEGDGGLELVPSKRSSPFWIDLDCDGRKDLATGNTEGQILCFLNSGTDQAPLFNGYVPLQANSVNIDLSGTPRSRPWFGDCNGDGIDDMLVGAADGFIRLYIGHATENPIPGSPRFAEEELLRDATDTIITRGSYSTPSMTDWNSDGLPDLLSGEKDITGAGQVRIWLNSGTLQQPVFTASMLAMTADGPLNTVGEGCLGVYARAYDWNGDSRLDLVLGLSNGGTEGSFEVWLDTAAVGDPVFARLGRIEVGDEGSEVPLAPGKRGTFDITDLNGDGVHDFVFGDLSGSIAYCPGRPARNGVPALDPPVALTSLADLFPVESTLDANVGKRASICVIDLNGDGLMDIVTGNTSGWVIACLNTGTANSPLFEDGLRLDGGCGPIDLPGDPRSRPWLGDFDSDGRPDLLVGALDGMMHLFRGIAWEDCFEENFAVLGVDGPESIEVLDTAQFSALPCEQGCSFEWQFDSTRGTVAGDQVQYAFDAEGQHRVILQGQLPDGTRFGASKMVTVLHERNHAPQVTKARLQDQDGLLGVTAQWWDYEGADEQYQYKWLINGVPVEGFTDATFPLSEIPVKGVLHCQLTPVDSGEQPVDPIAQSVEACALVADVAPGWNLLYAPSFQQVQQINSRADRSLSVRSDNEFEFAQTPVWVCDSEQGVFPDDNKQFAAGHGFWNTGQGSGTRGTTTVAFLGRDEGDVSWHEGWNVVGTAEEKTVAEFAIDGWQISSLWQWDVQGHFYRPLILNGQSLDAQAVMQPGVGYWATLESR